MDFHFSLTYKLAGKDSDIDAIVKRIYDTGCDFGLGTGKPGWLGVLCTVDAASMDEAVHIATTELRQSIPSVMLVKMEAD
jgi:hypothetical protein